MVNPEGNAAEAPRAVAASPGADEFDGSEDHSNSEAAIDEIGQEDGTDSTCRFCTKCSE